MANLPDPVLDKLRCYKCKNFLSSKPISVTSDGLSLCGRCRPDRPVISGSAYECVADYFLFPCKNWLKHCAYLLNIKEVPEHEKNCKFGNTCSMMCSNPGSLFKSDNKLDLSAPIKFYNVPEQEILNILTCHLCGYYLSSAPIHINADSLSICHRCYQSKDGKIPMTYIRHYALEHILQILLFPCIYRRRGCTKVFKFGLDTDHETMCSYARPTKSFPTHTDPSNGKQKGVIETHTGHMYGTITPYSQFFTAQVKVTAENYKGMEPLKIKPNERQERFFNELIKHRESLQYQWHRNSKGEGAVSPPKLPTVNVAKTLPDGIDEIEAPYVDRQISNRSDASLGLRSEPYPGLRIESTPSFRNEPIPRIDPIPSFRSEPLPRMEHRPSFRNEPLPRIEPTPSFRIEPLPSYRNEPSPSYRSESFRNGPSPSPSFPKEELMADDRYNNFRQNPLQDSDNTTPARAASTSSIQDNFTDPETRNGNTSPSRAARSTASGSDTINSRGSSVSSYPNSIRTPLRLNPGDLMQPNSFTYPERQNGGAYPEGEDSFTNNYHDNIRMYSPQLQYNGSFRN